MVFAHRGASKIAPENTLISLEKAKLYGATAVECDVQLTVDYVAVIFHDSDLDRTTNGHGCLAKQSYETIENLDAGAWFSEEYRGQRIPTLAAWLDCAANLNLWLNIEMKLEFREQAPILSHFLIQQIQKRWPTHYPAPLISSFSLDALECVAAKTRLFPLALASENCLQKSTIEHLLQIGVVSVHHPSAILDLNYIQWVHDYGLRIIVYTINDRQIAEQLKAMGVDGIFSDDPDLYDMNEFEMSNLTI